MRYWRENPALFEEIDDPNEYIRQLSDEEYDRLADYDRERREMLLDAQEEE